MKESAPTRARDLVENFAAHGNYHFTSAEVKAALGVSSAAAKQALRRMSIKGLVASPARGFYVMVPPEYRRIGCLPPDQFIPDLMAHWNLPYYVGLLSAAQYYGAAHHRPQHFQVVLAKNRPPVLCGSVMVMFVARGDMAAVPTQDFNTLRGTVRASTAEATAVDLVGYAHRAGRDRPGSGPADGACRSVGRGSARRCRNALLRPMGTKVGVSAGTRRGRGQSSPTQGIRQGEGSELHKAGACS